MKSATFRRRLSRGWLLGACVSCLRAWAVPVDQPLNDVTHGAGTFVAVGQRGTIYSSVAGGDWTRRDSGLTNHLRTVSFGDGVFVAAGEDGTVVRSTDGVRWTAHSVPVAIGSPDSAWGGGQFVVMGSGPGASWTEMRSTNGVDWSVQQLEASGYLLPDGTVNRAGFGGIGYGNGMFLATGGDVQINLTLTSTDGVHWKEQPGDAMPSLGPVAFFNNQFATVAGFSQPTGFPIVFGIRSTESGQEWRWIAYQGATALAAVDCGFAAASALGPSQAQVWFIRGRQNGLVQPPALTIELPQAVAALGSGGGRLVAVGSAITELPLPSHELALNIEPKSADIREGMSALIYAVPQCFEPALEIRWYRGETEIPDVRGPVYFIPQAAPTDTGSYHARMTLADGTVVRSPASELTILITPPPTDPDPLAPMITHPIGEQRIIIPAGAVSQLTTTVIGFPQPTMQWRFNGIPIQGATNSYLAIHQASVRAVGTYDLVATNRHGTAISGPLRVELATAPMQVDPGRPPVSIVDEGSFVPIPPGLLSLGTPTAMVKVLHDGESTGWRVGTAAMVHLKQARLSDAGEYQFIASRAGGEVVQATARLEVRPVDALGRWERLNPLPFNATILDLAFGAGRFVAVAEDGMAAHSDDGANWTPVDLRTMGNLNGVAYGNDRFIAAGTFGLVSSTDGIHWTNAISTPAWNLTGIAFGDGRFIAVGDSVMLTSMDGNEWREIDLDHYLPRGFRHVAFGNGRFVVTTYSPLGDSLTWVSSDGLNWETFTKNSMLLGEACRFVGGRFVEVGSSGWVRTSPDGKTWTSAIQTSSPRLIDVAYGNGRWAAVGNRGRIISSSDGVKWRKEDSGTEDRLEAVIFANGRFLAGGENGTTVTSVDGSHWTPAVRGPASDLDDIAIADDKVLIVGKDGTILVTTNGVDFSRANSRTSEGLHGIGWAPGLHVAVGEPGIIITSPDAKTWTVRPVASKSSLKSVAHGANCWVAVGTGGEIIRSEDGAAWAPIFSPTANDLNSVAYGKGLFVVVGDNLRPNGTLLTSPDGLNWTRRNQNYGKNLRSVSFLNDRFIATGNDGYRLESEDGVRWNVLHPAPTGIWNVNLRAIASGAGRYVIVGNSGSLFTSGNGTNWLRRPMPTSENLHGAVHFGGRFIAIGNRGTILRSDVVAPSPELRPVAPDAAGSVRFRLFAEPGIPYQVEAADDLSLGEWVPVATGVEPDGSVSVRDVTTRARRFYRAVIPSKP